MIHEELPKNFNSKFEIVSCFIEHNGKILLLHRQDHKPQGNTWGVPAGKVDSGEEARQAIIRETFEETSINLPSDEISYFKKIYIQHDGYDFIYHIFHLKLNELKEINIRETEHKNFTWISPIKALEMNLLPDTDACIKLFYKC